jgi:Zn-dependent protease with chaperone function
VTRVVFGVIVSGAAATVVLLVASLVSAVAWPFAARRIDGLGARVRAQLLAAWRLFPAAAAGATGALALAAFLRFEPSDTDEVLGALLPLLATAGLLATLTGLWRLRRVLRETTRVIGAWNVEREGQLRAMPIVKVDVPFPVVAVVGIWRPRLFVATSVVAMCEPRELDAMIAHEAAHVAARDNLTRLLFAGAPIVPFVSGTSKAIETAWIAASEEAADDVARVDQGSALALASALTKVARMASRPRPLLHASAILSGTGVERRVRRLLEPAPVIGRTRPGLVIAGSAVACAAIAQSPPLARALYEIAEYCVQSLP